MLDKRNGSVLIMNLKFKNTISFFAIFVSIAVLSSCESNFKEVQKSNFSVLYSESSIDAKYNFP